MTWQETLYKPSTEELKELLTKRLKDSSRTLKPMPPTTDILKVFAYDPILIEESNDRICGQTPVNMTCSLIAGLSKEELISIWRNFSPSVPDEIKNPYSLISNVPLYYYNQQGEYDFFQRIGGKKGINAERVLIKHIFGDRKGIGIVIKGPLSGLILGKKFNTQQQKGMCINRIWNDYNLSSQNPDVISPGSANITKPDSIDIGKHVVEAEIYNTVKRKYLDLISQRSQFRATNLSHLFFHLCAKQGIEVDTTQFHTTVSS